MKVLRRREEPGAGSSGAANGGGAAGGGAAARPAAPKVLFRAARPAEPEVAKPSRDEEEAAKVAALLGRLGLSGCDGMVDVVAAIEAEGFAALQADGLIDRLAEAAEGPDADGREAALLALSRLPAAAGRAAEPYLLPLFPKLLAAAADRHGPARDAAGAACAQVAGALAPAAGPLLLPVLLESFSPLRRWQAREAALRALAALAAAAPAAVTARLPDLVPVISDLLNDPRDAVREAAADAGAASYQLLGNRDIEHLVDDLLHCVTRADELVSVVDKLSATTFVQAVEAPALAVMVPLLLRALRESPAPTQRRACVIISNMARLVSSPAEAARFLPPLVPGVEKVARAAADPELRCVASSALTLLGRILAESEAMVAEAGAAKAAASDPEVTRRALSDALAAAAPSAAVAPAAFDHVAALCRCLMDARRLDAAEWRAAVASYVAPAFMEEGAAEAVARDVLARCTARLREEGAIEDLGWDSVGDDDTHQELCNCKFSLAYGGKILLNGAWLRLLRGRRYGLCGANGVGKSTLMRAISRGQLEGFPSPDMLKTVYVEHDIQASLADRTVLDYVAADPEVLATGQGPPEVEKALASVGFDPETLSKPIAGISGGWKMKLALSRAMLLGADILLLDEPTNHLDATNVAWLQRWLVAQGGVTAVVVSHDSGFLDAVCTDIIHYHNRQLRRYRGDLTAFVAAVPAAASYCRLTASGGLRFRFPVPGLLDGITSREKPIIRVDRMNVTYPGAAAPTLSDAHVMCRLSSRVAVVGANGAGKTTLIKVMTGELKPDTGSQVWRHPNLRLAYVAQHAFHHLEDHLDSTPLRYMMHRYGIGTDREEESKVDRALEEEDKKRMAEATWVFDGQVRRFNSIVGRRKKKKDFEYEVQWQGLSSIKYNRWIPRAELLEKGFGKKVNEFDQKKAATALGADARPLNRSTVEKFLSDFGLESEYACHSNIRGLSGGQKVKLVLAAAMWNSPHLLIMDEPTNYLDRDSLAALAAAIREFEGGVVLISHNAEFTSTCCNETWTVADGRVAVVSAYDARQAAAAAGGGGGAGGGGSSGGE